MMKKYIVECIGTFFLTFTLVSQLHNPIGLGLMYMLLLYVTDAFQFSGYFNPAITVTLVLKKVLLPLTAFFLMLAQFIGALLAQLFWFFITSNPFIISISQEDSKIIESSIEALLSFLLCVALLKIIAQRSTSSETKCILAGLTLAALAPFEGILNPTIAASATLVSLLSGAIVSIRVTGVYSIAPFIGSALAILFFTYLTKNRSAETVN